MTVTLVLTILGIAFILLLVEILIVPGIGIPGVLRTILLVIGVIFAYRINMQIGHVTLASTAAMSVVIGFLAFNSKTWDKLAHKEELLYHVEHNQASIAIGTLGKTVSRLNPMGNAMINETIFEVTTRGEYLDPSINVKVLKVEGNKIVVQQA